MEIKEKLSETLLIASIIIIIAVCATFIQSCIKQTKDNKNETTSAPRIQLIEQQDVTNIGIINILYDSSNDVEYLCVRYGYGVSICRMENCK